jgi:hypothetical protein
MGRRRSIFNRDPKLDAYVSTVRIVVPDSDGWPHFRSCDMARLRAECGEVRLSRLAELGIKRIGTKSQILGEEGRARSQLCAITDDVHGPAPSALHVVTRLVPTLKILGLVD